MILLNLEELLHVATRTLGSPPEIRDVGLLELALVRPRAMRLTPTNDAAYALVIEIANGGLNEVPKIASAVESGTAPR